jgi:hypothetical protein
LHDGPDARTIDLGNNPKDLAMRLAPFGLGLLAVLSACAPTEGGGLNAPRDLGQARQCFDVSQVSNFRQGEANALYFRVGRSDVYRVQAAGGCRDLDFANQLAILPDPAGVVGSRICTGDWARILVPGSMSPASACRVRIEHQLSTEEIQALPSRYRP